MALQMEKSRPIRIFLICMIVSFIFGASIFLTGFFPINNYALDRVAAESKPKDLDGLSLTPPTQIYAQTILMLVDALRFDFASQNGIPFSYNNSCNRLKLRVNIPTVTMPRLKSLTTGTVSNFIDIILNIGHVEQLTDSLLHRLQERNETTVFAGDRTWISLFPKQFTRFTANSDSFFVNDFYEGDKNVTEVLSKELLNNDWMLLVLHYLGLDHIGHVEGSESAKIPLKLKEMDEVVLKLYNAKHFHRQLLLLTGDHGMRDGGGHGGSTTGEMYVPLFVFKENCTKSSASKSNEYNQIDMAPTLAILWSMEIPPMSIGCLIPELLHEFNMEDQLYAYYYNALHLVQKANSKFDEDFVNNNAFNKWFTTAKSAHKQFLLEKRNKNFENTFIFEHAKVHYLRLAREISNQLSDSLVQFDYGLITLGLMLTTFVTLNALLAFFTTTACVIIKGKTAWLCLLAFAACINKWCHYQRYFLSTGIMFTITILLAIMANTYLLINIVYILFRRLHMSCTLAQSSLPKPKQIWLLLSCLVFHTLTLASSSYIEYENITWHYLGASTIFLLFVQNFQTQLFACRLDTCVNDMALYKVVLRNLLKSHTSLLVIGGLGILYRLDGASSYLTQERNKAWLSFIFGAGLILYTLCLRQHSLVQTRKELVLYFFAAMLIYCYRALKGVVYFVFNINCCDNIVLNIFWLLVVIAACISTVILHSKRRISYQIQHTSLAGCFKILLTLLLTVSLLLHKPHNVLLVAYLIYTLSLCYELCDKCEKNALRNYKYKYLSKLLCTILVGNMFYFYQGNSNSFATIDINPGYIGQTTYNPIIVGILVTLNMYSAQFIAFLYLITHILQESVNKTNGLSANEHINFIIYFYTLSIFVPVLIYFWLLLLFRYHLFIYSVFAPKAFYEYYRVFVLFFTYLMTTINLYIFDQ
ncbi:GPI ethanolamine phosphate transferase 2 [Zeugodacus cucurbitae]|uniref:GPI ethanolamine phosphate transferase 2 n=1 Tax=Zeugodacus cucurbitae TaxID=28588 RepID=UPI0023D8FBD6|nr:GPI ethanolamine phosphate transferase 2 [Zeugodacus cucurbitae]